MTKYKIQHLNELEQEMRAVARGEKPAPVDAAQPGFNSVDALMRLLNPENRRLLSIIRDQKPQSIAALANLTRRAASNLTRTLAKLELAGLVEMKTVNNRKTPVPVVQKLFLEIDPYSQCDSLEMEPYHQMTPNPVSVKKKKPVVNTNSKVGRTVPVLR